MLQSVPQSNNKLIIKWEHDVVEFPLNNKFELKTTILWPTRDYIYVQNNDKLEDLSSWSASENIHHHTAQLCQKRLDLGYHTHST
jgi:hypothetical protein